MMTTMNHIITLLMDHPSPEVCIVSDNLIVAEYVPAHLVRRIRHMHRIESMTHSRAGGLYRLIVRVDTSAPRVSESRIGRVSTRKHEAHLNASYQRMQEHNLYVPHRTKLGVALPTHKIRIGSTAKCVGGRGQMRPLH